LKNKKIGQRKKRKNKVAAGNEHAERKERHCPREKTTYED